MIFQFMWTTVAGDELEQNVPVLWHGEHLRRNGWSNPITLCFMHGLELLSSGYKECLRELGYELVDCAPLVTEITARYPQCRQLSTTSRFWFLRWNVLQILASERGLATVVHLDGDVVLLASPSDLLRDIVGKTFMLQGCPALTVISDMTWFNVWQEEFARFLSDRKAYIAKALQEKELPVKPDREYCNICAYGQNRFEDQDMLEYLIAAGQLPQARTAEVFETDFYWIQNPLLPGEWHQEQVGAALKQAVERNGVGWVGDKRIALYHFQKSFTGYCRTWRLLNSLSLGKVAPLLKPAGSARRNSSLVSAAGQLTDMLNLRVSRRVVYEFAFQRNRLSGNLNITDILNSCWE